MKALGSAQMAENKAKITELLLGIGRQGTDKLVEWLNLTDYFTAPASKDHHLAVRGGLAQHSLNVYEVLKVKNEDFVLGVPHDSLVIVSLLHDICKVNYYIVGYKNVKVGSGPRDWERQECWDIKDKYPMGHGEKSVFLARAYISLNDVEALAIRWHMGNPEGDFTMRQAYSAAIKYHPLVAALHIADEEASHLMEREAAE